VRRLVRAFARSVANPRVLRTAGAPGAGASLMRHVGRTSGRIYETPVDAEPLGDGFVVALPYGTSSNWVRNVLATGGATVVHEGVTHHLGRPELLPLEEMIDRFPPEDRRMLRWFRVRWCLRLHGAPEREASVAGADAGHGLP
jgi:deazaflavin-dependent oxidoreductase (nitroreductase family)